MRRKRGPSARADAGPPFVPRRQAGAGRPDYGYRRRLRRASPGPPAFTGRRAQRGKAAYRRIGSTPWETNRLVGPQSPGAAGKWILEANGGCFWLVKEYALLFWGKSDKLFPQPFIIGSHRYCVAISQPAGAAAALCKAAGKAHEGRIHGGKGHEDFYQR